MSTGAAEHEAIFARLRAVDTPTVCNAIEVVEDRRGYRGFTPRALFATFPEAPPMLGYARTARIASAAPSCDPAETVRARRLEYYRHMGTGPTHRIAVVGDIDGDAAGGAFWGEINARIHRAIGCAGALTGGLVRDLGDLPRDFPILAGAVGPSHGFVHVVDIAAGAHVAGLDVAEGDLLHADRHGALRIPVEYLAEMPAALDRLRRSEAVVLDAIDRVTTHEDLAELWRRFEDVRQ